MRNWRRRGVALFVVLLVMFVLLTLLGAFVRVNNTNLNLLGLGLTRVQAEEACNSAVQYAWMRLDKEADWGSPGYFTSHSPHEVLGSRLECSGSGTTVTGKVNGTDMTFTIQLFNNLNNASPDEPNRVPKYAVRMSIEGRSGNARKHMEVVLRKRAFVDASAVAQLRMAVTNPQPMKWNIDSTDRQLNMVRSNGTLLGPNPGLGGGPSQIEFLRPAGTPAAAQGPFGSAWASDEITLGTTALSGNSAATTTAGVNTKGQFVPKTGGSYQIPDLKPEDLTGPTTERTLPGGTYSFLIAGTDVPAVPAQEAVAEVPAVEAQPEVGIPGEEGYQPAVEATPAVPGRAAVAAVDAYTQWNQSLVYTDPAGHVQVLASVPSGEGHGNDYTPVPLNRDVWVPLALDPATGARTDRSILANLKTCQIVVAPGIKAVVPSGDLRVDGQLGSGNLALGTRVEGAQQEEHDGHRGHRRRGRGNAQPEDEALAQPSSLEALDGNISIYGAATGWGAIVSHQKDISLRMRNALATDPDGGVALYAGGDVTMLSGRQSYGVDCSDATFLGLIYAKGNFLARANQQNLNIEGALVSKGAIDILEARNVNFKYNPDFLFDIIDTTSQTSATRLEQVSLSIR
ncbi:MAG: hypothetical protein KF760_07925 [Candidatus Eremiobacteraeota bacterium]|nr:hypothetical protein [Candidatus Eremiobacteraeota bacterium]MCW5869575.1 hypothetical protein [Candidatus Eremiobacteraeota bacterium]